MKSTAEVLLDLIHVALGNAEWTLIGKPADWRSVYELSKRIVNPTCVQVEFASGWRTRWLLVKSMWGSRWKYKLYSEQNILTTFLQMVGAFVFEKHPTLDDH